MLKLFKNLNRKDLLIILACILIMVFQVWIELRLPEYMSEITRLIETNKDNISEIMMQGVYMLLCSFLSMISAIIIGYFASSLSASFSLKIREKVFKKVNDLSNKEMKEFKTSSLITRTTNDVTQIEMLIAMGLQALIKAPIMAFFAVSKILGKSVELSSIVGAGVLILLINIIFIMISVLPKFKVVQKLTDGVNNIARENLMGIRVIRAFNASKFEGKRFNKVNTDLTNTHISITKTFARMSPIMNMVMHSLN